MDEHRQLIETLSQRMILCEVQNAVNPYLTYETLVRRGYKRIASYTNVPFQAGEFPKTALFSEWHEEIFLAYKNIRATLSADERLSVEHVLGKDSPHTLELTKFACCWFKYEPEAACRWFAVDGILGVHPKAYVQDAFAPGYEQFNKGIRTLYTHYSKPEQIKVIVDEAYSRITHGEVDEEENSLLVAMVPDIEMCVGMYIEAVGEVEIKRVVRERRSKMEHQPNKRKKLIKTPSPAPLSP